MNGDDLFGYAIWRAGTSVGKDKHFLSGVGDPVHWLLRVLEMMASITMIALPALYYFTGWKSAALLWIAGGALVMVLLIAYLERKWVQLIHKNNPKVWSGMS
jgi:hypothetical protein